MISLMSNVGFSPASTPNEICIHSPLLGILIKEASKSPTYKSAHKVPNCKNCTNTNTHSLLLALLLLETHDQAKCTKPDSKSCQTGSEKQLKNNIPMKSRPTVPRPSLLTHLQNYALSVIVFSNPAKVTPTEDITRQCCPQTSPFR